MGLLARPFQHTQLKSCWLCALRAAFVLCLPTMANAHACCIHGMSLGASGPPEPIGFGLCIINTCFKHKRISSLAERIPQSPFDPFKGTLKGTPITTHETSK